MSGIQRKAPYVPAEIIKTQNVVVTDSEDDAVERYGTWVSVWDKDATDLSYIYSESAGSYLEFSFRGTGLWIRFFGLPDGGKANISIDNGEAKELDTYLSSKRVQIAFVASNLTLANHKVKVEVTGTKNELSAGYKVAVDAFIVELSRGAMQIWAMVEAALIADVEVTTTIAMRLITVFVDNDLDQDVEVRIKGNRTASIVKSVDIGTFTVNKFSSTAKSLSTETSGYLPYLYLELICRDGSPTEGSISAYRVRSRDDQELLVDALEIRDTEVHTPETDPEKIKIVEW